jgi:probable phosphoglycerate mutase
MAAAPLRVHATSWAPSAARVTLNITLDAAIVPSAEEGGCRVDTAHVVCLDDALDAASCDDILARLAGGGGATGADAPPHDTWERRTADTPDAPRTWGLTDAAMRALESSPPAGMVELQSRLCELYPEYDIRHQPDARRGAASGGTVCERFVANAPVAGDSFAWHCDADPSSLPPSAWATAHGDYVNRERGKPLFVSALLYLDAHWPDEFDAETLFLDPPSGAGIFVRPRRGRVVLMDQDVTHRVSPPSARAGRPRYSLVWKVRARAGCAAQPASCRLLL